MKKTKSDRADLVPDVYVGDSGDYYGEETYYKDETSSCNDVLLFCFKRSFLSWMYLVGYSVLFLTSVYGYFFGITLLGAGVEVFSSCQIGSLLGQLTNPVTCVLIGMLTTSISQSSSATSAVISTLVGNTLTIKQGIYVAMGSNLGNTVTNTILVLGHIMNKSELERVVAGVSVNDFFLFFGLFVFVPLEAVSGMLYRLSGVLVPDELSARSSWIGFTGNYISPFVNRIIISNTLLMSDIASEIVTSCTSVYPVECEDGVRTFETCDFGTITCDNKTGSCPFLFKESSSPKNDLGSGAIAIVMALVLITVCLFSMVKMIRKMLIKTPAEIIVAVTNMNSYISMLIGCLTTALIGNSTLTESLLNPFLSSGVIELEHMFPWSLGCNIGMTSLIVLQSGFSGNTAYFHVALANFFFIVFSTVLWYPVPFLRKCVLHSSLILGVITRRWRITALIHVLLAFFAFPLMFLGIISLLQGKNAGLKAAGIVCLVLIGIIVVPILVWWQCGSGKGRFIRFFEGSSVVIDDDTSYGDNSSISESEEGTTVLEDTTTGGYEVRYKEKDNSPKGILKNRTGDVNVYGRENSLANTKRKRSKRAVAKVDSNANVCIQAVENCGVGA